MAKQHNAELIQEEGWKVLALQAIESKSIYGLRNAARSFNVKFTTLRNRYTRVALRRDCEANSKKLTRLEEDTVIRYILDLDIRGFSPILAKVVDIANKLLKA